MQNHLVPILLVSFWKSSSQALVANTCPRFLRNLGSVRILCLRVLLLVLKQRRFEVMPLDLSSDRI